MLQKAIEKINGEIDKAKGNQYIQIVGSFLINHLNSNPEEAEKVLNSEKTIAKSFEEMKNEANKKKVGNCAVLTDQEGFEIVLKYFEINTKITKSETEIVTEATKEVSETIDFDVKLEDYM